MKRLIFPALLCFLILSCKKARLEGNPPNNPGTIKEYEYFDFSLRLEWTLDYWASQQGDSAYFAVLPKFNTLPGLTTKPDSISNENIVSVKVKFQGYDLYIGTNISEPIFYNLTSHPVSGPPNTIMMHSVLFNHSAPNVDSVYLRLKYPK